jgi:hypothetical protein
MKMTELTTDAAGKRYEIRHDDIDAFIHEFMGCGYHKITLEIDATSIDYMEKGLVVVTVHQLSEHYDRMEALASV